MSNIKCQKCSHVGLKTTDTRPTEDGRAVRRRQECKACGARFTTYEIKESDYKNYLRLRQLEAKLKRIEAAIA